MFGRLVAGAQILTEKEVAAVDGEEFRPAGKNGLNGPGRR